MPTRSSFRFLASFLTAALLSACAGSSPSGIVPSQSGGLVQSFVFHPQAAAPKCAGQKTSAKYASVTAKLSSSGGVFCVPSFGGFGGSIEYPSAKPSVSVTITTSTTNYNHQMNNLGKGKPMLYIQIALAGGTSFGTHQPTGGGLSGKAFKSGKTYTAYGAVVGVPISLGSCNATATKGKYGGQIGGLGTLLKGQSVPFAVTGFVEIYPGSSGTGAC